MAVARPHATKRRRKGLRRPLAAYHHARVGFGVGVAPLIPLPDGRGSDIGIGADIGYGSGIGIGADIGYGSGIGRDTVFGRKSDIGFGADIGRGADIGYGAGIGRRDGIARGGDIEHKSDDGLGAVGESRPSRDGNGAVELPKEEAHD